MYRKFAALLLSVSLLLTACSEGQIGENVQPQTSETTTETTTKKADIGVTAQEPEETVFSEPQIGGNAVLSQDELNGYTAKLELMNIKSLPEGEDGFYTANEAHVRATLPSGEEMIFEVENGLIESYSAGIWANCAENAVKIFEAEEDGKKRYILMVYDVYVKSKDIYKAEFFDITEVKDYNGPAHFEYYWAGYSGCLGVSDEFDHKEGMTFADDRLCYEVTFESEYFDGYCTALEGFSPEFFDGEPEIGGCTVFAEDSLGEYTAQLVMFEIASLPSEALNAYRAFGGVFFRFFDDKGNICYTMPPVAELQEMRSCGVWADCTENAVKLYEIEWNGEKKYLLRGYVSYGTENGTYPDADPELYRARFYACNFEDADMQWGNWYHEKDEYDKIFQISDSLVYKGGNVLYDEKTKTELVIDPDNFTIDAVQASEE